MKKLNIGNLTVYSALDINIDLNKPIKLDRTLQDFENDEDMYRLYVEMESLFNEYEKRIENSLISENNKKK